MHDLRWLLLAWGVLALAAAVKFARLARLMRGSLGADATGLRPDRPLEDSEKVREQLERAWLRK